MNSSLAKLGPWVAVAFLASAFATGFGVVAAIVVLSGWLIGFAARSERW